MTKKITHSVFFALFLLGALAFTKSDDTKWYAFESKPFGFKVEFPDKPTEKVKVVNTAEGDVNLNMYEYVGAKDNTETNFVFLASYVEYPASIDSDNKEKLKEIYRKVVDGMATKVNGKILKETTIKLEGFEGVETKVDIKEGAEFLKARIYLIHNKMYMLESVTVSKNEAHNSIAKFMDSFRLIK
jgi:hypothetical protein